MGYIPTLTNTNPGIYGWTQFTSQLWPCYNKGMVDPWMIHYLTWIGNAVCSTLSLVGQSFLRDVNVFTDKIMETCKSTYVTVNCSKLNVLSHFKARCSGYQATKVTTKLSDLYIMTVAQCRCAHAIDNLPEICSFSVVDCLQCTSIRLCARLQSCNFTNVIMTCICGSPV